MDGDTIIVGVGEGHEDLKGYLGDFHTNNAELVDVESDFGDLEASLRDSPVESSRIRIVLRIALGIGIGIGIDLGIALKKKTI